MDTTDFKAPDERGRFFLGRRRDVEGGPAVVLDADDLTTHAAIIGMTGSGKTGLGIGLIEEAALDGVPVIALDPKGDLGNLLLTFPDLDGASFEPWVDPRAAEAAGLSRAEYAARQAATWRKGLAGDGQAPDRIQRLRDSVEMTLYTPGSEAGVPISVLGGLRPPGPAVRDDAELFGDQVAAAATSLLALLGEEADPVRSREHILLSTILEHRWSDGETLDLAGLIHAVQEPPFDTVGVLELDRFFPSKDRFRLATRFNNLLAAPGFEAWRRGVALDAEGLLRAADGRPRVAVAYLAHLSDSERMFFVCMLLNELIDWMRRQPGTGGLRALLYMDEVFGYLPPVAAPPSKALFLTLLKQARAYGLGLVLSTQNPVDLDYKALSNCGTWFLGRLQTERDKARVMEGLEGVRVPGGLDRRAMEATLAGLGKRQFLLHSVHRDAPVTFHTRWVMSYLAGPMTRDQVAALTPERPEAAAAPAPAPAAAGEDASSKPAAPPGAREYFLPLPAGLSGEVRYRPCLLALADVRWDERGIDLDTSRRLLVAAPLAPGAATPWSGAETLELAADDLADAPPLPGAFEALPAGCADLLDEADAALKNWIRAEQALVLMRCRDPKAASRPGESESEFRDRLAALAADGLGERRAELERGHDKARRTLEKKLTRARDRVAREQIQRSRSRTDTIVSIGSALLSLLGGRRASSRTRSATRAAGNWRSQAEDVAQAEAEVERLEAEMKELEAGFEAERRALGADAGSFELEEVTVRPESNDIHVHFVGLGWRAGRSR